MNFEYNVSYLPAMLKRKHFIEVFGISSSLYYKMINRHLLPTIKFNNRTYVKRDEFIEKLENGLLNFEELKVR